MFEFCFNSHLRPCLYLPNHLLNLYSEILKHQNHVSLLLNRFIDYIRCTRKNEYWVRILVFCSFNWYDLNNWSCENIFLDYSIEKCTVIEDCDSWINDFFLNFSTFCRERNSCDVHRLNNCFYWICWCSSYRLIRLVWIYVKDCLNRDRLNCEFYKVIFRLINLNYLKYIVVCNHLVDSCEFCCNLYIKNFWNCLIKVWHLF